MATMEGKFLAGLRRVGHRPAGRQGPLVADDGRGRLLLQQVPRGLLRADRLPDRLPEGELPGRVHGGGDLLGDVDQGQGARSSSTAARRWGSRCCRPTSTPPTTASSSRGNSIRFGLDAVKNVGHAAVEAIIAAREDGGPFESIWDFCERVDARAVNKRAIECLIKCGALDSTGDAAPRDARGAGRRRSRRARRRRRTRAAARARSSTSAAAATRTRRRRRRSPRPQHPPVLGEEFDQRELLRLEKETLGTFLSAHPLAEVRDALRARVDCSLAELGAQADGAWVTVGGIVAEAQEGPHPQRRLRDVRDPRRPRGPASSCSSATPPRRPPR